MRGSGWWAVTVVALAGAGCFGGGAPDGAAPPAVAPGTDYWMYVGAESADRLHLLRYGPDGFTSERSTHIGRIPTEVEGPHGVATSPDGRYVYMTTGHGVPDGHFWKFDTAADTLVAEPILLGKFPATLDLTPDGLYAFVVNFNLHGAMEPSSMSVVYTPDAVEVAQIEMCTMPHGVRMHPGGVYAYSVCMMDDQLVEVDTRTFEVSRRFSVATGGEAGVAEHDHAGHGAGGAHGAAASCSPTWAVPSADGSKIYVACNRSDEILEVDFESWTLSRRFATGRGPYNLDVTSDGRLLVATLKQGAAVEFFDLDRGEAVARTPTSTTVVHGVVISDDDRFAFVSVEGVGAEPGKVDAFELTGFRLVDSAEVGQQAAGIALLRVAPR